MAPRYWGEIILPEQRGPFIEQTISSLHRLAGRVAEYHLGPVRLTYWSCATKVKVDGHRAKQILMIKANGEIVVNETWGIFQKENRPRFPSEWELAELLEKQMIGLGDLQDLHTKIDIIVALRELMAMPQTKRLIRPVRIEEHSGGGYTTYVQLTSEGIEYHGTGRSDSEKITDPRKIDLAFVNRHRLLTLNDVKKAKAKITPPKAAHPTSANLELVASPEEAPYLP